MIAEGSFLLCRLASWCIGERSKHLSSWLLCLATKQLFSAGDLERKDQLEADFFHLEDDATKLSHAISCAFRFRVASRLTYVSGRHVDIAIPRGPYRVFEASDVLDVFGKAKFARTRTQVMAMTMDAGRLRVLSVDRKDWRRCLVCTGGPQTPIASKIRFSGEAMTALYEMANDPKRSFEIRPEDFDFMNFERM